MQRRVALPIGQNWTGSSTVKWGGERAAGVVEFRGMRSDVCMVSCSLRTSCVVDGRVGVDGRSVDAVGSTGSTGVWWSSEGGVLFVVPF